jgi:hypothetical protein
MYSVDNKVKQDVGRVSQNIRLSDIQYSVSGDAIRKTNQLCNEYIEVV